LKPTFIDFLVNRVFPTNNWRSFPKPIIPVFRCFNIPIARPGGLSAPSSRPRGDAPPNNLEPHLDYSHRGVGPYGPEADSQLPPPARNASQREFPILRNSGNRKPEPGSRRAFRASVFKMLVRLWRAAFKG